MAKFRVISFTVAITLLLACEFSQARQCIDLFILDASPVFNKRLIGKLLQDEYVIPRDDSGKILAPTERINNSLRVFPGVEYSGMPKPVTVMVSAKNAMPQDASIMRDIVVTSKYLKEKGFRTTKVVDSGRGFLVFEVPPGIKLSEPASDQAFANRMYNLFKFLKRLNKQGVKLSELNESQLRYDPKNGTFSLHNVTYKPGDTPNYLRQVDHKTWSKEVRSAIRLISELTKLDSGESALSKEAVVEIVAKYHSEIKKHGMDFEKFVHNQLVERNEGNGFSEAEIQQARSELYDLQKLLMDDVKLSDVINDLLPHGGVGSNWLRHQLFEMFKNNLRRSFIDPHLIEAEMMARVDETMVERYFSFFRENATNHQFNIYPALLRISTEAGNFMSSGVATPRTIIELLRLEFGADSENGYRFPNARGRVDDIMEERPVLTHEILNEIGRLNAHSVLLPISNADFRSFPGDIKARAVDMMREKRNENEEIRQWVSEKYRYVPRSR